jgi:hypothetical protein
MAMAPASLLSVSAADTVRPRLIDFSDPFDNLRALVRVLADETGASCYSFSHGRIFSVVGEQLAQPLLDFKAARIQGFRRVRADAWETRFRGMIYFCALESGEIIDSWRNPYTGSQVSVTHWATLGESGYTYTTMGLVPPRSFRGEFGAAKENTALRLPWLINGDDVWLMLDERVKYVRRSDGAVRTDNAINRYHTSLADLENPKLTSVSCRTSWHTEQNWMPWMAMPKLAGHLMWGGAGRKYAHLEQMPREFVAEIERRNPGALTAPLLWNALT